MLSVIILILKIIGIAIAAILGLALFVILLVLFVPIRYRGEAHKGEAIQAEGKVSWLFGFILFKIRYSGEKTRYALRICGFKIFSDEPRKKISRRKKKVPVKKEKQQTELALKEKPVLKERPVVKSSPEVKKTIAKEKPEAEIPKKKEKKPKVSFLEKVKGIFSKLKSIKRKIRDMLTMIKGIFHKVGVVRRFLFDYKNRPGFKVLFKEVKALIRHIWPTSMSAYVHFGMEDPSQTGQILGAVCAIYPQILSKVKLNPDFEQKVLEGDVQARGRIRIFNVLVIAVRVIINKEFKIVWKNAKRLKEEL